MSQAITTADLMMVAMLVVSANALVTLFLMILLGSTHCDVDCRCRIEMNKPE